MGNGFGGGHDYLISLTQSLILNNVTLRSFKRFKKNNVGHVKTFLLRLFCAILENKVHIPG